jgi:hypothetical protein
LFWRKIHFHLARFRLIYCLYFRFGAFYIGIHNTQTMIFLFSNNTWHIIQGSEIPKTAQYRTENIYTTIYFQSFHNLKIHNMVKAIDLSPIIALGPE